MTWAWVIWIPINVRIPDPKSTDMAYQYGVTIMTSLINSLLTFNGKFTKETHFALSLSLRPNFELWMGDNGRHCT